MHIHALIPQVPHVIAMPAAEVEDGSDVVQEAAVDGQAEWSGQHRAMYRRSMSFDSGGPAMGSHWCPSDDATWKTWPASGGAALRVEAQVAGRRRPASLCCRLARFASP